MTQALSDFKPPSMRRVAREALERRLARMRVGDRLPPLAELARELGIGRISVQEAMRDLAQEGVVVSRPRHGTFVARTSAGEPGRLPAHAARGVLAGRRVVLGCLDATEPVIVTMIRAAAEALDLAGARVIEARMDLGQDSEQPSSYEGDCDLCLLFNPPRHLEWKGSQPLVVVSTSWHESFSPKLGCDLIGVDQVGGAALAGRRFRQLGFREACFIGVRRPARSGGWDPVSTLRLRGLERGLGQTLPREHQLDARGYSVVSGGRGFRRYTELTRRPAAVFAICDEVAVGFVAAAEAVGLRPGRDFHLIGFDGLRIGQSLPHGPLTTVAVPAQAMGQLAAEVAVQRLLQPQRPIQTTYLDCELQQGKTTGRAIGPAPRS